LTFEREEEICSGFSQAGIFFADQKIITLFFFFMCPPDSEAPSMDQISLKNKILIKQKIQGNENLLSPWRDFVEFQDG